MPGLYIHIPFCKQACHYCDFHFSTNLSKQSEMVDAIITEMTLQKNYLEDKNIDSVYFGGGTPSLLSQMQFERILLAISAQYTLPAACEITVEANPDDLALAKLIQLKDVGINRLSIGVQSFDNTVLKFMNRSHDSEMAKTSLVAARKVGFTNISLDLMYAIPGQPDDTWAKNIDLALQFAPEHISTYSLTIEDKTVFGNWYAKKKILPVDESVNATQYELLMEKLNQAGYEHYEISNFSKQGYFSRHNSSYWKQEPYLGLGPSAHSYDQASRQFNIRNNAAYIKSIEKGKVPFEKEILSYENKINEYVFTALRTSWGCDLEKLQSVYGYDLMQEKAQKINALINNNYLLLENRNLKLSSQGKLLADYISVELMT